MVGRGIGKRLGGASMREAQIYIKNKQKREIEKQIQ